MDASIKQLAKTLKATGFILSEQEAIKRAQEIIKAEKKVIAQQKNAKEMSLRKAEIFKKKLVQVDNRYINRKTQYKITTQRDIDQDILKEILEEPLGDKQSDKHIDPTKQPNSNPDIHESEGREIEKQAISQLHEEATQNKTIIKSNNVKTLSEEERAKLREKQLESKVDLTDIFRV